MNLRIGRLRIVDLLLFVSGALQLHLLFSPSARMEGGGEVTFYHQSVWAAGSPFRFVVLVSGVMAIAVLPLSILRRSPASALSIAVGLVPIGFLNVISIAGLAFVVPNHYDWSPSEHYELPFYLLAVNGVALFGLAIASLRSEGRGLNPDPSPEATTLKLDDMQSSF